MMGPENALGAAATSGVIHHPPKAKRVVQLFMGGAASHLDLFDFKPALIKHHAATLIEHHPSPQHDHPSAEQLRFGPSSEYVQSAGIEHR